MFSLQYKEHKGYGLYTKNAFKKGDKVLRFEGTILPTYMASVKHSMTLNGDFAFEWNKGKIYDFINHSCNPNCRVDLSNGIPELVALRDIPFDGEICYNYNTTEFCLTKDLNAFSCHCGGNQCTGHIKGFLHLTTEQEKYILDICTDYIKEFHKGD